MRSDNTPYTLAVYWLDWAVYHILWVNLLRRWRDTDAKLHWNISDFRKSLLFGNADNQIIFMAYRHAYWIQFQPNFKYRFIRVTHILLYFTIYVPLLKKERFKEGDFHMKSGMKPFISAEFTVIYGLSLSFTTCVPLLWAIMTYYLIIRTYYRIIRT